MKTQIAIIIGYSLVILANIIWYRSKFILKKKGYQIGWFSRHFSDFSNLEKAIEAEENKKELHKLVFQKKLMLSIWVIFPVGIILMLSNSLFNRY